ncbi:MAG: hypothetical protein WD470_06815 [Rhodospirillaceae bacterium]
MRFRPKRALYAIMLAALVSACMSTAAYEAMLDGWVGRHVDALVQEWGPPQATHSYEDGRRSLQYRERTIQHVPPVTAFNPYSARDTILFPGTVRELACITTFEADAQGIVRSWKWRGNDCAIEGN